MLACSPTASALALDDFPDDGLFFRTVPSDSMQAAAIVQVAEQTGVPSVIVVYVDDALRTPALRRGERGLAASSLDVDDRIGFPSGDADPGDADARRQVQRVVDATDVRDPARRQHDGHAVPRKR